MTQQPITRDEFNTQKEAVLSGFQISSKPTIKSISALFFSGLISTFGIYSILLSMDIKDNALYKAIGIFIVILIVADTFKRGALANYLNSVTRKKILETVKTRKMQLVISLLALSFMFVFDVVGSVSTANYTEQSYQDFRATNSKEFQLMEAKAKSGSDATALYMQLKNSYDQSESKAQTACNNKWRVPKYRTKNGQCMEAWYSTHSEPKLNEISTSNTVNVDDYKSLKKESNEDFLSNYMFYIILFLSLALTMLLQYTTLSEILEKHEDIDETLTPEVVGILQDRISELETNMIMHETERNELISDSDREEKNHKRKFEKLGKAIQLLGISKAVDARGETVQRIANNNSFPLGNQKAGFVKNPLYREPQEQNQEPQPQTLTESLLFDELFLEERGKESDKMKGANEKLNPKSKVINTSKRKEVELLSKVYKMMVKSGVAELRGNKGYYSLMDYSNAWLAFKEEL